MEIRASRIEASERPALDRDKRGGPGGIRTHDSRIRCPELYRMIEETIANPIDGRIQRPGSLICLSVTLRLAISPAGV